MRSENPRFHDSCTKWCSYPLQVSCGYFQRSGDHPYVKNHHTLGLTSLFLSQWRWYWTGKSEFGTRMCNGGSGCRWWLQTMSPYPVEQASLGLWTGKLPECQILHAWTGWFQWFHWPSLHHKVLEGSLGISVGRSQYFLLTCKWYSPKPPRVRWWIEPQFRSILGWSCTKHPWHHTGLLSGWRGQPQVLSEGLRAQ